MTESKNLSGEYDFASIEKKWQNFWVQNKTFKTPQDLSNKKKYYVLDMFPYPSGNGLHVGHVEGYTATDIVARLKRMQGYNVLHPMGWDAFGLPAEQYAIKTSTHPRDTTEENINTFRKQMQRIGLSYDWDREVDTTDPKYYRWTQWIFLQLFNKGLAYESHSPVNWCPALGTVLANEEVVDGKSEVGGFPVERKPLRQWVLKITEYAERLLQDLDGIDWPDSTKEMQRNWIGKSFGAEIAFQVAGSSESFKVFTTRPDTLFGATFCVLAPEHPILHSILGAKEKKNVLDYIEQCKSKSDMERSALGKEKNGVFTGAYAVHPFTKKSIPIYTADYVLVSYGTGAIMAVPAHDERDHEFAKKYKIDIVQVVNPPKLEEPISEVAYTGDGILINSDFLNGLDKNKAIEKMCSEVEKRGFGKKTITYRLRDWVFSRQRYWGEPFPLAHDKDGKVIALTEADLPVMLPELEDYKPSTTGEPPLSKASDWLNTTINGKQVKRETNIMPQWAGSCWYYLRFIDPHNDQVGWDNAKEKYWMPVDLYIGGAEHANLHLLYARFWHKVLFDLGYVSTKEPFQKIVHQGTILGENNEKMSKSKGNVVNPDEVIAEWGSDSLRLFEMFLGPLEQMKPWSTSSISGVHRFLKRLWRLVITEDGKISEKVSRKENSPEFAKVLHQTIKKVTEETVELHFNTAISAMMELVNSAYKEESITRDACEKLVLMVSPYAPHMAEELWNRLGKKSTLAYETWPQFDPQLVIDDSVTVAIMIDGKTRGTIELSKNCSKDEMLAKVKALEVYTRYVTGRTVVKEIVVPGKIVNFVTKD